MILPCIDLMGGKVVQLVQGREKVLEGKSPDEMLDQFEGFPQIQVIDLDAAMGTGSNRSVVEHISSRATVRVGGGVRTVDHARSLVDCGAYRVILGTAVFSQDGLNRTFLDSVGAAIGPERITAALDSKGGKIVVKGWKESTSFTALEMLSELEPYCSGFLCTYVDKEGMMQGTDLEWFLSLRKGTTRELIAAGGITTLNDIRTLLDADVHAALGMSIYTGRLNLHDLKVLNQRYARN